MKVICKHCLHEWDYISRNPDQSAVKDYVCCPRCLYRVNLKKQSIKTITSSEEVKNGT